MAKHPPELNRRLSSRRWRPGIGDRAPRGSRPGQQHPSYPDLPTVQVAWATSTPVVRRASQAEGGPPASRRLRAGRCFGGARFGTDKFSEKHLLRY
jgi:hypothetical protein